MPGNYYSSLQDFIALFDFINPVHLFDKHK